MIDSDPVAGGGDGADGVVPSPQPVVGDDRHDSHSLLLLPRRPRFTLTPCRLDEHFQVLEAGQRENVPVDAVHMLLDCGVYLGSFARGPFMSAHSLRGLTLHSAGVLLVRFPPSRP